MRKSWETYWKDYYRILQVHPTAEDEVIRAAYTRLSKKYHPDVNQEASSNNKMKEINEAFEVLGNLEQRRLYHPIWLQKRNAGTARQGHIRESTSRQKKSEPPSRYARTNVICPDCKENLFYDSELWLWKCMGTLGCGRTFVYEDVHSKEGVRQTKKRSSSKKPISNISALIITIIIMAIIIGYVLGFVN